MPPALPILYSFRRCPYAMRARLALAASNQVCELREIVLSRKPADMLSVSPKGTVPVLVLPDGTVLEQSLDIMLWALQQQDPSGWLQQTDAERTATMQRIAVCDGPFKQHLDRYKYPNRYALESGLADRDQGAAFLMQWEAALVARPYLAGVHFGLCDAAIAPFVRQFAHTDMPWFMAQPWPHLRNWLNAFEASSAYAEIMEKFPEWAAGAPLIKFPIRKP